jgi:hypothetical protein
MYRLSIVFGALFLAGCATTEDASGGAEPDFNLLGIIKVENESYEPTKPTDIRVSEGEVVPNENPTGRKVELLWGLVSFTDY